MIFYLLGFPIALTTIFGIIHSQTARETLHLQNLCKWFSLTIQQQLQKCNVFGVHGDLDDNQILSVLDIQRIQDICQVENSSAQISGTEEISSTSREKMNQPTKNRETILTTINASLKRLSTTVNSESIEGAQICHIHLQESNQHKNVEKNQDVNQSENLNITIHEVKEENTKPKKPKMYFGESPLEYVPHQK